MTGPDAFADDRQLPPGQRRDEAMRVMHYGRVPRIDLDRWRLTVTGATLDGREHALTWSDIQDLPQSSITADHHCVARHSVLDVGWSGVPTREIVARFPPPTRRPMSSSRPRMATAPTSPWKIWPTPEAYSRRG